MKNLLDKVTEYFSNVSDEELDLLLEETEEYKNIGPYVQDYLSELESVDNIDYQYYDSIIAEYFGNIKYPDDVLAPYSCYFSNVELNYDMAA